MIAALEQYAPHHQELRKRLIFCFVTIAISSAISYTFIDSLAALFLRPLFVACPDLEKLVYTKLTDAFITYLKLSLMFGITVSFPVIMYQLWMFISPGLVKKERRIVRQVVFWASFLFLGGCLFSFFIVLPKILAFFMGYAGPNLKALPKLGMYVSFVSRMVLTFGIAFEIPFVMMMASRTGLISTNHFQKKRNYFYVAILILSFLLSAGDFIATILLAFPLICLYEAGIMVDRVLNRKKNN